MIKPTPMCDLPVSRQDEMQALIELATERVRLGFAPPAEIYQIQYRSRVDWSVFPEWAKPVNPDIFDGCCHEG